jgi:hypothetical protein
MFTGSNNSGVFSFEQTTGVSENQSSPVDHSLGQNYPNPFNPVTAIPFSVARESPIELNIYNAGGRTAAVLVNKVMTPGDYRSDFDGGQLSSGIYFYSLLADGKPASTMKCLLLK